MSRQLLQCAPLLLLATTFVASFEQKEICPNQGPFSAAVTVLSSCTIDSSSAADATVVSLTACVTGLGAQTQMISAGQERARVNAAIRNTAVERADVCNVQSLSVDQMVGCFLQPTDTSILAIPVGRCDTIIATAYFNSPKPLPPIVNMSLDIQPTDGSGNKVNFGYRNTYLYPLEPSLNVFWYRLDVAVMFEVNPLAGSYNLRTNILNLSLFGSECILAYDLKVEVLS